MPPSVQLIHGNDEYAVSEAARAAVAQLVPPERRATQLDVIDGAVDTVDAAVACMRACLSALQSPGLFATERTVWIKGATFFADNRTGRSETVQTAVADLTARIKAGLPPGITLLITATEIDKRRAFYKACSAAGGIQVFSLAEKSYQAAKEAGPRLQQMAEKAGVRMTPAAQQAFLDRVGYESRRMASELEKLAVYMGEHAVVAPEDVTAICSVTRETESWDLADAFAKRDLPQTLRILRRLLFERQSPIMLLAGLEHRLRELLVYREAHERRWLVRKRGYQGDTYAWGQLPPSEDVLLSEYLARDPRANHPFRIGILAKQAEGFTRRELHRSLSLAIAAHERLVSSREPPASILERFIVRTLTVNLKTPPQA